MIPYEAVEAIALHVEDLTIAETVRTRTREGGAAPLSETAERLGLDPIDLLVIPRLLALLITLPLLTFIAMMAGLAGGITVGAFDLGIPPQMYLARMHETLEVRHFFVGMSKAPIFALIIGLIGCLEGLQVEGTAQSVGERTTSSVVQAISLVIILDALAALWFMKMDW